MSADSRKSQQLRNHSWYAGLCRCVAFHFMCKKIHRGASKQDINGWTSDNNIYVGESVELEVWAGNESSSVVAIVEVWSRVY